MVRIHHLGKHNVNITTGRYPNGRLAVQLTEGSDLYATISVNLPEVPLLPGEFLVKTYSENEGLLEQLLRAGAIEFTGRTLNASLGLTPVCCLPAPSR